MAQSNFKEVENEFSEVDSGHNLSFTRFYWIFELVDIHRRDQGWAAGRDGKGRDPI